MLSSINSLDIMLSSPSIPPSLSLTQRSPSLSPFPSHLVSLDVPNVTCEGSVSPDLHRQVLQGARKDGLRAAHDAAVAGR